MAEVEHKIRIVTEVDSGGTKAELQKLQEQMKNLGNASENASKKVGGGPGGYAAAFLAECRDHCP